MTSAKLSKHYGALDPAERLALLLATESSGSGRQLSRVIRRFKGATGGVAR